jgi:capsular polysaccharide biosynthesis protein
MEQHDIDLRPIVMGIASRWRRIIVLALTGAVIAASIALLSPKSYTASASVLVFIRQTGAQIGIGQPVMNLETIDIGARRQGLIALARSNAIEAQIPSDILQQVAPSNYRPGLLTEDQKINVRPDGDLIVISATASTPEQARLLADAWATTYVDYARSLYTDQHSQIQLASTALLPLRPSGAGLSVYILSGAIAGVLIGIMSTVFQLVLWPLPADTRRELPQEQSSGYPVTG